MFRVADDDNDNDVGEDDLIEPLIEVFGDHFKADILDRCAWWKPQGWLGLNDLANSILNLDWFRFAKSLSNAQKLNVVAWSTQREDLPPQKMFSFGHCQNYLPPSPYFGQRQKLGFAHMTEKYQLW